MNRVVVLGGTGFVGHALCEKRVASDSGLREAGAAAPDRDRAQERPNP